MLCFVRELWRKEAATDQTIQNIREELSKVERNLRGTVGKVSSSHYTLILSYW